jgi:serine/threonine-protein kinase HipA
MGRKKQSKTLCVYLNGIKVGDLRKETGGQNVFKYHGEWLGTDFAISHSLPIREQEYKGEIVARYFDNLLPDNEEIKKALAQKFGAEGTGSFDILNVIGRDCVGALSFIPEHAPPPPAFEMKYRKLTEKKIAKKIRGLSSASPLGMEDGDFRLSIAGAQEKTALLEVNGKWCEPEGMTPTTHIIKTPLGALNEEISLHDSVDNEWASLLVCRKFGLPTCHSRIESFEDQRVLVVERFDRKWRDEQSLLRIPQEDMCQALGVSPYQKYQNEGGLGAVKISKFLAASKNVNDRETFFKALLVFDLLWATDGHAKNFSTTLTPSGASLTPLYDVTSGYFLHARERRPLQKMKLAMGVGDSNHYFFSKISLRHYRETAKKCALGKDDTERIFEEVSSAGKKMAFTKAELDPSLNPGTLETIQQGMRKRLRTLFG